MRRSATKKMERGSRLQSGFGCDCKDTAEESFSVPMGLSGSTHVLNVIDLYTKKRYLYYVIIKKKENFNNACISLICICSAQLDNNQTQQLDSRNGCHCHSRGHLVSLTLI